MKKQQEQQSLRTGIETQQKQKNKNLQETIICSLVEGGDEKFIQTSKDLLSGRYVSPISMLSIQATTGTTTLRQ